MALQEVILREIAQMIAGYYGYPEKGRPIVYNSIVLHRTNRRSHAVCRECHEELKRANPDGTCKCTCGKEVTLNNPMPGDS